MSVAESELAQGLKLNELKGTKSNKEFLAYVEGLYRSAKDKRLQFERQWYLNMAFYFGRQYAQWVAGNTSQIFSRLYEPPAPAWRVRLVVNKVRSVIRTELSKVTKEKPRGFVIPSSSDDEDLAAARAADQILEHLFRELEFNKLTRRTVFWELLCGTSFIKDWFDPGVADTSNIKGAITLEHVSPFHLFVADVQEEDIEKQPYVIHAMAKEPDWVDRTFNKKVAADSDSQAGQLEQKFLSALGIQSQPKKSHVVVKEAWIKPCKKFDSGAVVIWAGDEVLGFHEGFPYQHNQYPFTKFDHIPTGRFYGDSTIVDLISLQKEYNRTRSQLIEAKNRMAKPQLIAPRGSIDPNKVTTEPGLIIFYTPGYTPPEPIPLAQIPQYVIEELDRTQRDMDDISSQHEVTKGRTPPGVTAATAISYLQEEDDSKLSSTISSLEEGVEKIGRHCLSHVQQFWDAARQIRVIGENDQYEAYKFTKANIAGNTDFRVEAGSATPRSRAAKQAFIMELGKMGWIPPDRALRYLDMAETGRLYEEMQIDVRQAQYENMQMDELQEDLNWMQAFQMSEMAKTQIQQAPPVLGPSGMPIQQPPPIPQPPLPIPVNSWDEDIAHLIEHDNRRKRQTYQLLPDFNKLIYEQHINHHKQKISDMLGLGLQAGDPRLDGIIKQLMGSPLHPMAPGNQPGANQNQLPPEGGV